MKRIESPFVEAHMNRAVIERKARPMRDDYVRAVAQRIFHRVGQWIRATRSPQTSKALP